jgi:excisionase family DNA binding protein
MNAPSKHMTGSFDIDRLLDALAEKVAARLRGQVAGPAAVTPRLLTVEEAGRYLGRSKESVQHLVAGGKVPTVRSDRRVFLDVRDLDAWIEATKSV